MKLRDSMELVGTERLVRLLRILDKNVRDSASVSPFAAGEVSDVMMTGVT